jgi:rhamnosyltransferase subunit B
MNKQKHIVLTTIGSLGDLHPMIALALELQRRGHLTTIVTTEFYRSKIEELGLAFAPMRPDMSPENPELMRHIMDLKKGPEFIIRQLFMPRLREMYDDLAAVAREADFIVSGELGFATQILAEQHNLRWAMAVLQPSSFFSAYDPSVLAPLPFTKYLHNAPTVFHKILLGLGKRASKNWGQPIADLRRELGLPELAEPLFKDKYSPYLNLAMFSKVMGTPQPDWAKNTVQTGFVFYDKYDKNSHVAPELQNFLDAGEPPVIFTLGTSAVHAAGNFYEESIQAVKTIKRRAVLLIGKNAPPANLPVNIAAFDYAPFSEVLPRAACVVHQGGVGTTAQVLRAGVPHLVVPWSFDQPDNAARVERLGVAQTISRNAYSSEKAAKVLAEIFDNSQFAIRAKDVAREVQAEDGIKNSCDAIEEQLN